MSRLDPGHDRHTEGESWSALAKEAWRQGEAAANPHAARSWLERARRLAPEDDTVLLSLGLACLRAGDAVAAKAMLASLVQRFDIAEVWLGLAASALSLGDPAAAAGAMQALLSRHVASPAARALAASVAAAAGLAGWCALDSAGRLHVDAPAEILADGRRLRPRWADGSCAVPSSGTLSVTREGIALLGSPIDRQAIWRVEGCVLAEAGRIVGWAWYPGNPDRDPVLLVAGRRISVRRPLDGGEFSRPLARPRQFDLPASVWPNGPVTVTALDGRPLAGSPIYPNAMPRRREKKGVARGCPAMVPPRALVDIVIPVHDGMAMTLACLDSVLPTLQAGSRVHVVDDASQEPALRTVLDRMAAEGRIVLHRLSENRGFPTAANLGLRAVAGRDVVLLNSDTVAPPDWLAALADAAYSTVDIGTACPLSNDASILSYPDRAGGNPMPVVAEMAAVARQANGADTVDIPVAVGFCMFIRHDCLEATGLLREDLFSQGYGEEVDWCLRAGKQGWRHVAVPGCFVAHRGGGSFGMARKSLMARNAAVLNRLHPGYDALIATWSNRDPLGPARRRMDILRWGAGRCPAATVLVTHAGGGGVDRVVGARVAALRAACIRPVVLRPDGAATVVDAPDMPNLRFHLPTEWADLLGLLHADRVNLVELHHMLGHSPALHSLAGRLGVAQAVFVHDYAWLCARINLVRDHRYCGEPPVDRCVACVAIQGSHLEEPIGPVALVARSAAVLAGAERVVVPSADTATRLARHFPAVSPVVEPLEDDAAIQPPPPWHLPVRHICVVGAIGTEKGYDVLLGCVADAAHRRLPLRFTVVGFTSNDARLLAAGPVFVTGPFKPGEAEALIRQQDADLAFIPSVWPETWCFSLGEAWRAGLRAIVFDLGAPAERVRRTGWGHVLPLGLPPGRINDWLLSGGPNPGNSQSAGALSRLAPSSWPANPAK